MNTLNESLSQSRSSSVNSCRGIQTNTLSFGISNISRTFSSQLLPHFFHQPRFFGNVAVVLVSPFSFAATSPHRPVKNNDTFGVSCELCKAVIVELLRLPPVSRLMLHVVFYCPLMAISSCSPPPSRPPHTPSLCSLFHKPCALYLPGPSAPSCLWMLPSRSCDYDGAPDSAAVPG